MHIKLCSHYHRLFFKKVFRENSHPHSLIYLHGISLQEMLGVLEFMYSGKVEMAYENLPSFIKTAEALGVKGLVETDTADNGEFESSEGGTDPREFLAVKTSSVKSSLSVKSPAFQSARLAKTDADPNLSKSKPECKANKDTNAQGMNSKIKRAQLGDSKSEVNLVEVMRGEKLNKEILAHMEKKGPDDKWECKKCEKGFDQKRKAMFHVESHLNLNFPCTICSYSTPTRNALKVHCLKKHEVDIGNPFDI